MVVLESDVDVHAFIAEVAALHRSLHDVGDAVAGAASLTRARFVCLREVAEAPRTVSAVATRQGVARQGVQRTADGLVADGLAAWADNPRHRRAKLLAPTSSGTRALAQASEAHERWMARAAARLPGDLAELTARLTVVRHVVAELDV